jgi:group I intron endonuclease
MKGIGVYNIIHTSKPNLAYIGSSVDLERRKRVHISSLNKGSHHSRLLQRVVNKYGLKNLVFSIIEFCKTNQLMSVEQKYLDSLNPEYNTNILSTSSLGVKRSKEFKAKVSGSHIGKKMSKETMDKIISSRRLRDRWHGENWYAAARNKKFSHSDKTKKIISEKLSGRKLSKSAIDKRHKIINQYSKSGVFIKEWASLSEIKDTLGVAIYNISSTCHGKRKSAHNFIWNFKK